jgi:hypothetical protein
MLAGVGGDDKARVSTRGGARTAAATAAAAAHHQLTQHAVPVGRPDEQQDTASGAKSEESMSENSSAGPLSATELTTFSSSDGEENDWHGRDPDRHRAHVQAHVGNTTSRLFPPTRRPPPPQAVQSTSAEIALQDTLSTQRAAHDAAVSAAVILARGNTVTAAAHDAAVATTPSVVATVLAEERIAPECHSAAIRVDVLHTAGSLETPRVQWMVS